MRTGGDFSLKFYMADVFTPVKRVIPWGGRGDEMVNKEHLNSVRRKHLETSTPPTIKYKCTNTLEHRATLHNTNGTTSKKYLDSTTFSEATHTRTFKQKGMVQLSRVWKQIFVTNK